MRVLSGMRYALVLAAAVALVAGTAADRTVQRAAAAQASFSFNWVGTPAGPQPWSPAAVNDWDLIVHNRDNQSSLQQVNAEHGSNCAAYPATHPVTSFADSVFICNNHMMTALNGGGYGEIVMTPSRMLDFSSGGTVQVSISTAKLDNRDWLDFWISPFSENLLLPSGGIPPDLQGPTKDALLVNIDSSIPTTAHVQEFHNYVNTDYSGTGMSVETCVSPLGGVSTTRRDPFLLTLSRTHVRLDVLVNGAPCPLVDTNIADLGFGTGVVQLGHHSYAPDEGTMCNLPGCSVITTPVGAGNTWHWSNFTMSPAVAFTMLRGDMALSGVKASTSPTVHFAGAAPDNSFLRFSALARRGSIQISANGGPFFPAQLQMQHGDGNDGINDASHIAYWTPIPAGTANVTFKAADSTQPWTIQDVAIWSSDQANVVPVTVPPPTNTGGGTGSGSGTGTGTTTGGGPRTGNPLEDPGTNNEPGETGTGGGGNAGGGGGTAGVPPSGSNEAPPNAAGEAIETLEGLEEAMVQRPVIPWAVVTLLLLAIVVVAAGLHRRFFALSRRAARRSRKLKG